MRKTNQYTLHLKYLGIDTYKEAIIYMRQDCHICRAEGFEAQARIEVTFGNQSIIATLNTIQSDLLTINEASLSEYAWSLLGVKEHDEIFLSHPKPLDSLSYIRSKIYGNELQPKQIQMIMKDVHAGRLSDIHIAAFLTACASGHLNTVEITELTKAMINTGEKLHWDSPIVVDKHCVGGLPGNRTTLIVVPIVAAFGLIIPKTSSRAITSPAGTADTMEIFAPVDLSISKMRKVVDQEGGCIVWGGAVALSPTDDILIRIERALNLDSEGQLVASVLSKKVAAGSTHVVIDIPVGPTVKVRSLPVAQLLKGYLETIGRQLGITVQVLLTDGLQPVGRGIGPALEAQDVLSVLKGEKNAPQDLRDKSLTLAGAILEFSRTVKPGLGKKLAEEILDSGKAYNKFKAICQAQGRLQFPTKAPYTYTITAGKTGEVAEINNRQIAQIAKLAGAPRAKTAGLELHVAIGNHVERSQPIYTIHSENKGELAYTLAYIRSQKSILQLRYVE